MKGRLRVWESQIHWAASRSPTPTRCPLLQQQHYPRQICLPSLIPSPPLFWKKSLCSWSAYRKSRLIWLGCMGDFYVLAVWFCIEQVEQSNELPNLFPQTAAQRKGQCRDSNKKFCLTWCTQGIKAALVMLTHLHTNSFSRWGFGMYNIRWPGLMTDSKVAYITNQQAGSNLTCFSSFPINAELAEITACLSTLWPKSTT